MKSTTCFEFLAPVCCAIAALQCGRVAATVTIYGGPEYSFVTNTGYLSPGQATPHVPNIYANPVNNDGIAVGYARAIVAGTSYGDRGILWNSSSIIELGTVGVNSS